MPPVAPPASDDADLLRRFAHDRDHLPQIPSKPHYEPDHRTCVLPVKLEPNHTYVIQLNYPPFDNFTDTDGRKAVRYLLVFQTHP